MDPSDLALLNFEDALEKKIVAVLAAEGLTDVRESEDYTRPPQVFSVVKVEIDGASGDLYRKPNGSKEYMHYSATVRVDHHVWHSQQNAGVLKDRIARTRGAFLFSRASTLFSPAVMAPYKVETWGPPQETVRDEPDEQDKRETASMSFSFSFTINPEAWAD